MPTLQMIFFTRLYAYQYIESTIPSQMFLFVIVGNPNFLDPGRDDSLRSKPFRYEICQCWLLKQFLVPGSLSDILGQASLDEGAKGGRKVSLFRQTWRWI